MKQRYTVKHFATLIVLCETKNSEVDQKFPKYGRRVVVRGDLIRDNVGNYAILTKQCASASHTTASKVLDTISIKTVPELRTSERRCKSIYADWNERRTWSASTSRSRLANDWDTATKIKTPEKLGLESALGRTPSMEIEIDQRNARNRNMLCKQLFQWSVLETSTHWLSRNGV